MKNFVPLIILASLFYSEATEACQCNVSRDAEIDVIQRTDIVFLAKVKSTGTSSVEFDVIKNYRGNAPSKLTSKVFGFEAYCYRTKESFKPGATYVIGVPAKNLKGSEVVIKLCDILKEQSRATTYLIKSLDSLQGAPDPKKLNASPPGFRAFINTSPNVDFVLIDPEGRKSGVERKKAKPVSEIPHAVKSVESDGRALIAHGLIPGKYTIKFFATSPGPYKLELLTDYNGSVFDSEEWQGVAKGGEQIEKLFAIPKLLEAK
jgi:hypothetical protein